MNDDVESFETVPWNIDQIINEITCETEDSQIDVQQGFTCDDSNVIRSDTADISGQDFDFSFLEAPYAITEEEAAEQLLNLSDSNRLQYKTVGVPAIDVKVDVAAVVNEAAAAVIESGQTENFDPEEEEKKLLSLLQIPTQPIINETIPTLEECKPIKCSNCCEQFTLEEFEKHVCEYDDCQQLITSASRATVVKLIFPEEPPAFRLLRENQIRIRRFLKEELKYEIPLTTTVHHKSNSSSNNVDGKSTIQSSGKTDSEMKLRSETASKANSSASTTNAETKKQETTHECTICDRRFVHPSGLLRHMEKHTLDLIPTTNGKQSISSQNSQCLRVIIRCQPCGRVFFDPKSAISHLMTHFPSPSSDGVEMDNFMDVPYEAFVDDAMAFIEREQYNGEFSEYDELQQMDPSNYLKIIILGNVLQCEFCDFIFTDISYLFLHSSLHSPERRFECLSCGINATTSKDINNHFQAECIYMRESFKLSQTNTQRFFVCNVCEKKFQSLDHLHEHRYTALHFFPRFNPKLQKLQTPCEYCELTFETVADLLQHFEEQHSRKCRRDRELGIGNNNASTRLRQYLCDVCGKSYTQSSHLWQHLRFHQGVKPFACQEPGCSRKFTIRPDLHDHIRKCHTGERPFHCHICGKRFLTGSVFYQHRLIHRGERRYECNQCGKRFYRADALKNHTRIHTGEKPFDCEFCTKSFRQRGDCDKHIRARHSHLDENTRNMLKRQKLSLKSAAAAKKNFLSETQTMQKNQTGNGKFNG